MWLQREREREKLRVWTAAICLVNGKEAAMLSARRRIKKERRKGPANIMGLSKPD